jgi:hypothetical protein
LKRLVQFVCVIAIAATFSGCPLGQFRLGVWVFFISNAVEVPAVDFNPNGTGTPPSQLPNQADTTFMGVITWERNGSTVTIDQVIDGGFTYQYVGQLSSPTEMGGSWQQTAGGNSAGLFTAQWVSY